MRLISSLISFSGVIVTAKMLYSNSLSFSSAFLTAEIDTLADFISIFHA